MSLPDRLKEELEQLKSKGMYREIPKIDGYNRTINGMINLSSNDYLGLLNNSKIREAFIQNYFNNTALKFSSASSRLLTGNCTLYNKLEDKLASLFNKEAALIFNSGYHANSGILPALTQSGNNLILADKLVHASIIDGIKLSGCKFFRYQHNNYTHLRGLVEKNYKEFDTIFIVTEALFSMDGDFADIQELVKIKEEFKNIVLYIDEAHSFGSIGEAGLGLCYSLNLEKEIDIIVGTFGKAISSVGAFAVTNREIREYLINKMRPLIFSTALPEINIAWSYYIIEQLPKLNNEREHLKTIGALLREAISTITGLAPISNSFIVPFITGSADSALELSNTLKNNGFYGLAVRPPTVPPNSSRIRFSLTALVTIEEIKQLISILNNRICSNEKL